MFNSKWINGKDVNGQSFDYQYVVAEAYWPAKATFTASAGNQNSAEALWHTESTVSLNAAHIGALSAEWNVSTTVSDTSVLQTAVFAEASWEGIATAHFTGYRQTPVSCEWIGLSNSTFMGGGVLSLIPAPIQRDRKSVV
jgi:hypothetical protein